MFGIGTGILYAIIIILAFIVLSVILDRYGLLEPAGMELSGPFLMWKTEKGKKLIDRISQKKRFWENYGNLAIVITVISMVLILLLVIWSAYLASSIPQSQAPSPQMIIGIPGVNPLIPIWYGIAALAIAIIVHEFSHGILARTASVKIKSLGMIFIVVPIGAFVEPDEDEMDEVESKKRSRIYAAGPTTNIILALVLVLIFSSVFMGSIQPRQDGIIAMGVGEKTQGDIAGIERGEEIVSVNGTSIGSFEEFMELDITPMRDIRVKTLYGRESKSYTVKSGLAVIGLVEDLPAKKAGLEKGDVISRLDGKIARNYEEFSDLLDNKSSDERLNVTYHRYEEGGYRENTTSLLLENKYGVYQDLYPSRNKEEYRGEPYMGVMLSYLGIRGESVDLIPQMLGKPYAGDETIGDYVMSSLEYISLPFLNLSPVPTHIAQLYQVTGPLSLLPSTIFWTTANLLYWVFWLNLMVGLFNSLPAVPLDGGYIFQDGIDNLFKKFKMSEEWREKAVSGFSYTVALFILFLIMWQLIGPRI